MTLLQCLVIAPRIIENIFCYLPDMVLQNHGNYTPRTTKLLEGGLLVSLRPSLRPSVCTTSRVRCVVPTVLVGSISYLYILLSNYRGCVACYFFLQNLKFGIWCESLVWVNMGRRGKSQNAGVLVVLVLPVVKTTYLERPPNLVVIFIQFLLYQ